MEEKSKKDIQSKLAAEWQNECQSRYGEKARNMEIFSESGLPLNPVYTSSDIEDINDEEIGMPGVFPFTRGNDPLGYRFEPIKNYMFFGYGLPEDTRERMDLYLKTPGANQFIIATDMPTYYGYDPDHFLSKGRVGQCGVSLCNTQDLATLFDGVPLESVLVGIGAPFASPVNIALLVAYAEKRGFPPNRLRGVEGNRMYKASYGFHPCFPAEKAMRCMVEVVAYCSRMMPEYSPLVLCGYTIREQGANAVQELAFILAISQAITEGVIERGLSPDDYLSKVTVKLNGGNDFFEEIAKFRAFRKLWAKINLERFGCKDPKSLRPEHIIVQTAGNTLTAQQPLNNIVRVTVQTLAAVIGGIPFVDPAAYDEALSIPTEEAETIALRTGQILSHESNIKNVTDPMAGSYYVEYLTKRLEEEVYRMLERIEDRGGFIKSWEDGWFRSQIEEEAYEWGKMLDRKEKVVVGVNEYRTEAEPDVPLFQNNPEVEKIMVERLREFKYKRDDKKVKASLDHVGDAAKSGGELIPALVEAARADATSGEMMDVLRKEYGWRIYR
ncbi:methylmalonyl-CoA mutase family protein [Thermodesulfobacteriota bacterium]